MKIENLTTLSNKFRGELLEHNSLNGNKDSRDVINLNKEHLKVREFVMSSMVPEKLFNFTVEYIRENTKHANTEIKHWSDFDSYKNMPESELTMIVVFEKLNGEFRFEDSSSVERNNNLKFEKQVSFNEESLAH